MLKSSTIVVVPFLLAIATFLIVFYGRERAYSVRSHNFVSAVGALLCMVSYLALRVIDAMSLTLNLIYAAVAVGVLIWAFICTRI